MIRGKEMKKRLKKMATLARSGPGFMGGALLAMLGTICPVQAGWLVEQQELAASDAAESDAFGGSVAVSGDTAVVGAAGNDGGGSAYVFKRTVHSWSQQAKLTPSDAVESGEFGYSVAISGDVILVGDPQLQSETNSSGSAYVFVRNGSAWTEQTKLVSSDAADGDHFGISVGVSGRYDNWVVVGASGDQDAGVDSGSAYVFNIGGDSLLQFAKLMASDASERQRFGSSVAISGSTILVGAGGDEAGSAYIYSPGGLTYMSEDAKLTVVEDEEAERGAYGYVTSVAISGDTAVLGAVEGGPLINATSYKSANVFVRSDTNWIEEASLPSPDSLEFGPYVAISGETLVIGAGELSDPISSGFGQVDVYTRNGATWSSQAELKAVGAAREGLFGRSVAISDGTVMVGAPSLPSAAGSGSAYIFDLTCAPYVTPTRRIPDNQWMMIGLPCDPGVHNTVMEAFGDEIPGAYGKDWIMFSYDGNGYAALEADTSLSQGVGYWILQRSGIDRFIQLPGSSTRTQVTNPEGCLTSAKGCFEIPLTTQANSSQWNLISYPFWNTASLADVRVVTDTGACVSGCDLDTAQSQGILHNELWSYNGEQFDTITSSKILYPLLGYWALTLDQADGSNPRLLVPKPAVIGVME